jgi:hypothetical protein
MLDIKVMHFRRKRRITMGCEMIELIECDRLYGRFAVLLAREFNRLALMQQVAAIFYYSALKMNDTIAGIRIEYRENEH